MDAMGSQEKTDGSSYLAELAARWRLLLIGVVAMGVGYGFSPYVSSIMGPHLIAEFGWSRAEFASINAVILLAALMFPLAGRLNDLIGVKRAALIGVISMPICYALYTTMNGDMKVFLAIYLTQAALGITTTAVIFTRLIVHHFNRARGLALAIVASGPAFFGFFVAPLLNNYVEAHGWRAGYLMAAFGAAVLGGLALLLLPSPKKSEAPPPLAKLSSTKKDYGLIFRSKAFWILSIGILLCHIPVVTALSQLTFLLQENGISTAQASVMLAAHGAGTLIGRFSCGAALDRFPMHIVAALGLGLPIIGLVMIASPYNDPLFLTVAVIFIALAYGAEADLLGYIISKKFGTRIYSSVLGLTSLAMSMAGATGAGLIALSMAINNTYMFFLLGASVAAAIGSLLLLQLKNVPAYAEDVTVEAKI